MNFDYGVVMRRCLREHPGVGDQSIGDLLAELDRAGVTIDFALLRPTGNSEFEMHRQAAIASMRLFSARLDCYFEELSKETRKPRSEYLSISIAPESLQGAEISIDEFLGDGFDLTTRKLTKSGDHLMNVERPGLVYAVCCPPHPVVNPESVLLTVLSRLFDWFDGGARIFRWNDAWSNYFDDGKEWWGTFYWTVHLPGKHQIVCVGASTTD